MSLIKAAILGKSLSHSISPQLHRELFTILRERYGADYTGIAFEPLEFETTDRLKEWIKSAGSNSYIGANVTYPYKTEAFDRSDHPLGVAAKIKSGNSLRFAQTGVECASTDGNGLLHSILREFPTFDMDRYHVVCIGAGSAAKAVLYSLCTKWMPRSLTIMNRSSVRAEELAEFCLAQAPGPTIRVMNYDNIANEFSDPHYRLVIQSTPVGQLHLPGNLGKGFRWHETDFAIDLNYNPLETTFLENAAACGSKTMHGLGMLIEQAALSQVFWMTGFLLDASPLSAEQYITLRTSLTNNFLS